MDLASFLGLASFGYLVACGVRSWRNWRRDVRSRKARERVTEWDRCNEFAATVRDLRMKRYKVSESERVVLDQAIGVCERHAGGVR